MPYVIDLPHGGEIRFPETCPYCGAGSVDGEFESTYTKGTGYYVVAYTTQTWTLAFPACSACVRRRRLIGRLALALIAGAWALLLGVFTLWGESLRARGVQFYAVPVVLVFNLAGGVLLLLRNIRHSAFRVAYIGDGRILFCARSKSYAEEFAAANGTTAEFKLLVVKAS